MATVSKRETQCLMRGMNTRACELWHKHMGHKFYGADIHDKTFRHND